MVKHNIFINIIKLYSKTQQFNIINQLLLNNMLLINII